MSDDQGEVVAELPFKDPAMMEQANQIAEWAIQKMIDQAMADDIVIMRKDKDPVVVLMKYSTFQEYEQAKEDLARISDGSRRTGE